MTRINTGAWREYNVLALFERIERGKGSGAGSFIDGDVPYIAASYANNGYVRDVEDLDGSLTSEGNCIALICNGNGGIGRNTYQANPFVGSSDLQLAYHPRLNQWNGMFIVACLDKSIERYNYSFAWKRNGEALKAETVFLPGTSTGDPDWDYMEQAMREISAQQEREFGLLADISTISHQVIDTSNWGEFQVATLFERLESGKCSNVGVLMDGNIPYLAASTSNNGFVRGVEDLDGSLISDGNCIAMICDGNGSLGRNTYQGEPFVGSSNLQLGYHPRLNQWNGMFLVSCLNKSVERYNYNFAWKRRGDAFKAETVFLPMTPEGVPDWDFMELTMRKAMTEREAALDSLQSLAAGS